MCSNLIWWKGWCISLQTFLAILTFIPFSLCVVHALEYVENKVFPFYASWMTKISFANIIEGLGMCLDFIEFLWSQGWILWVVYSLALSQSPLWLLGNSICSILIFMHYLPCRYFTFFCFLSVLKSFKGPKSHQKVLQGSWIIPKSPSKLHEFSFSDMVASFCMAKYNLNYYFYLPEILWKKSFEP